MKQNRRILWLQERKYMLLLASLILILVLQPILRGGLLAQQVFNCLFVIMLAAALLAVSQQRRAFALGLLLGVPAIVLVWAAYLAGRPAGSVGDVLALSRLGVDLLFLGLVAGCILHDVLGGERVTTDRLCGAISVYLLLGLIWALIYSTICYLDPNAFAGALFEHESFRDGELRHQAFSLATYYSFVTLSTLGYGDVVPVAPAARVFAWLEAVTGQLYLAVLIARLVGLHIVDAGRKGKPQGDLP